MSSFVGFSSQQLVQFQDCLQKDPAALVNISRTNLYSQIGGTTSPGVPVGYAPMAAAINVGILQPTSDLTNLLSSGCSSGTCTFSEAHSASFATLASGYYCTNATSGIRVVNEPNTRCTWHLTMERTVPWSGVGTLAGLSSVHGPRYTQG
jgi:hypothetical protein